MTKLIRQFVVIAMLGVVSAGAFAQRKDKDQDKRPPKAPVVVIERKDQKPPRSNTNQQRPKEKPKKP